MIGRGEWAQINEFSGLESLMWLTTLAPERPRLPSTAPQRPTGQARKPLELRRASNGESKSYYMSKSRVRVASFGRNHLTCVSSVAHSQQDSEDSLAWTRRSSAFAAASRKRHPGAQETLLWRVLQD